MMELFSKENIIKFCDKMIEWSFYVTIPAVTFSTSIVEITVSIMMGVWIIKKLLDRDFGYLRSLPFALLFFYAAWAVLSCINTDYPKESFRGVFKVAEYVMLVIVVAGMTIDRKKIKNTLYVIAGSMALTSINGFYQYFSGEDFIRHRTLIENDYLRRISSSFVHPNDFGAYLLVFLLVLISLLLMYGRNIMTKIKIAVPTVLSTVALVMTKSRGAWLSFVGGVFVLGSLISKKVMLLLVAGLIAIFFVMPQTAQERVFELTDLNSGTTWERLKLWEGTISMIKVHPVLGFGVNTYSKNFPNYRPADYPDIRYSHNCYLHMASEIGIPGALAYILFLFAVLWRGYSAARRVDDPLSRDVLKGLVAGLAGFALNAAVDTHLYSVSLAVFFHVLIGFSYTLTNYGRQEQRA